MVILNRIINILILLAAIAAAVFSYLLFSKREKLVNGWGKMADAIVETAKVLDKDNPSGTAVKDLPKDKLTHNNYEQLDTVLPKLKSNADKIVEQRNALADNMKVAADRLAIPGIDAAQLKNESAHKDQALKFVNGVKNFRSHRDNVFNSYVQTFSRFGANVSASDLANPQKYRSSIDSANLKVSDTISRRNAYADCLATAARSLNIAAPKVNTPGYRAELNKFVTAARAKNAELGKVKNELAAEKRRTQQLTARITGHEKTISNYKASLLQKDSQIQNLNNILSKDGSIKVPNKLLSASDPECYKFVKGVIEYVDKDYGFVTINIGKKYSFVQHYGIKENRVLFPLKPGKIMTVSRKMTNGELLFIGKIFVSKVEDNSSVCNLIGGRPELYREGDLVSFSDDDIAKALQTAQK